MWSIAASLTSQTTAFANRRDEDLQVEQLLNRLQEQCELEPHTCRTLLDILLAQGRFEDALIVLQPWLAEQPRSLNLALLSADLHRLTGNTDGALKELKRLLRLHPIDAQVLQLLVLVEQTNGNGKQALQDLKSASATNHPEAAWSWAYWLPTSNAKTGSPRQRQKCMHSSPLNLRPIAVLNSPLHY